MKASYKIVNGVSGNTKIIEGANISKNESKAEERMPEGGVLPYSREVENLPLGDEGRLQESGSTERPGTEFDQPQTEIATEGGNHETPTDPHRLARLFLAGRTWAFWNSSFWEYTGTRYEELPESEVKAILSRHIKSVFDNDRADCLMAWQQGKAAAERSPTWSPKTLPKKPVVQQVTPTVVNNALAAVADLTMVPSRVAWLTMLSDRRSPNLLAVRNGLLDLDALLVGETEKRDVLRPHTSDWFSPVCLPYDYDPHAESPEFLKSLGRVLENDPERFALVQEWFGYHLLRSTDAQKFMVMVGAGGNGKGTILAALEGMLGTDNVSSVPLKQFSRPFCLYSTLGKLANISQESEKVDQLDEGNLKQFVSGDLMSIDRKYLPAIQARPTARLTLATNNTPHFNDKTDGIWRRLLLVPFRVQIPEQQQVKGMDKPEYWRQELPGILNWAIGGLRRLKRNGLKFTQPKLCQEAKETHRLKCDPAQTFLREHVAEDPTAPPLSSDSFYRAYRTWAERNGHKPLASNNFAGEVRRIFPGVKSDRPYFKDRKKKQAVWLGLKVIHSANDL